MTVWQSSFETPETANAFLPNVSLGQSQPMAMDRQQFETALRHQGETYHTKHPFQQAMIAGQLSKEQIRGWVANRFYYQLIIPRKDAAILANCPDPAFRRNWISRILDHDGRLEEKDPGGIEAWILLGQSCGLSRQEIVSLEHVIPAVRFACDAYLDFARRAPWQEAVCSSLTELFAASAHKSRLDAFPHHYPWIEDKGLRYFRRRIEESRQDVEFSLSLTLSHFKTFTLQRRALQILRFKLDILWSILDAIAGRYG